MRFVTPRFPTPILFLGGALIAALLIASAPSAAAQRITPLPPRSGPIFPPSLPGAEPGAYQSRSHLVWDMSRSALDRRLFTVWDPAPSQDLAPASRSTDSLTSKRPQKG